MVNLESKKSLSLINFFGFSFILYGTSIIFFVFVPFLDKDYFESKPIDVIEVRTEIYQKNASAEYPIGALSYGTQKILLINKSNEKIKSNFVLKLSNKSNTNLYLYSMSDSTASNSIVLAGFENNDFIMPFDVEPHAQTFIHLSVTDQAEENSQKMEYPIAVQGWGFRER